MVREVRFELLLNYVVNIIINKYTLPMKATKLFTAIAGTALALMSGGCADMIGVGMDYAPGNAPSVYYYDNYYTPSLPWWGVSTPPPPPLWGTVITPPVPPLRPAPIRPQKPPQNPPQKPPQNNGVPGVNIPTHVGGQQRPGNGGLPSNNTPAPSRNPDSGASSNNSRR